MTTTASRLNPFAMMLDPEAVISAMEDSMHLRRLRQRICRPLDKPLIPKTHGVDRVIPRNFDRVIDTEEFMIPAASSTPKPSPRCTPFTEILRFPNRGPHGRGQMGAKKACGA